MDQHQKEKWIIIGLVIMGVLVCGIGIVLDYMLVGVLLAQLCWVLAFSRAARFDDSSLPSHWRPMMEKHKDSVL